MYVHMSVRAFAREESATGAWPLGESGLTMNSLKPSSSDFGWARQTWIPRPALGFGLLANLVSSATIEQICHAAAAMFLSVIMIWPMGWQPLQ